MKKAKEAQKQLETEYIQGKIDLIDEKWEDAFKHFDRVIRRDSDFFKAWHYKGVALDELGTALGEVGKYEESIACYDSTLQIEPKYELAQNNRILMLMSLERFEEAQEERKKQSSEKKRKGLRDQNYPKKGRKKGF